jgi:hypothetical protein
MMHNSRTLYSSHSDGGGHDLAVQGSCDDLKLIGLIAAKHSSSIVGCLLFCWEVPGEVLFGVTG